MTDAAAAAGQPTLAAAAANDYDAVILGGGLAGLTLALQLKRTRPETRILVLEKRGGRAPEATFKVGESTGEIGAHYLRNVVGLADHLDGSQLRKFGLRFFITAGDNSDIAARVETSSPRNPAIYAYQLDRGRLENEMWEQCLRQGVHVLGGCRVGEVQFGSDQHTVAVLHDGASSTVHGRWVVDAAGRAGLLKRQLGLASEVGHHVNAAWFRLGTGLDVEDWSQDPAWRARVPTGYRKHATNHLTGEGYWVWLIQLASGPISIGIVADPTFHPFDSFNDRDKALDWLTRHEPQLAETVAQNRDQILDFLVIEDFSLGCQRMFSPERWCLTGEAGVFADPLYSPGTDFITYANSYITDVISRDLAGEDVEERIELFNYFLLRFFDGVLSLYEGQYHLFGNPQVMVAKVMWNNFSYFAVLPLLYLHGKLIDVDFMLTVLEPLDQVRPLLSRMELLFREWHTLDQREWKNLCVQPTEFSTYVRTHANLAEHLDDDALRSRLVANVELYRALVVGIFHKAAALLPVAPIGEDVKINPGAVSLQPERWEADGLFDPAGMSLAEARPHLAGLEEYWLDEK